MITDAPAIVLFPAYQPTIEFITLLKAAKTAGFITLVVNDGSGEDYQTIFKAIDNECIVLTHQFNQGKGAAIKTGLAYIKQQYPQNAIIITMDIDDQHTLNDALSLLALAQTHPHCLILGCRNLKNDIPIKSAIGNTLTRWIFYLTTKLKISDTQTGLRAFDSALIDQLLVIKGTRYEYEMNVLLYLAKAKIPIIQTPIATIYLQDNASTHFNPINDSFRIYKEILLFSLSSIISFVVDYTVFVLLLSLMPSQLILANLGARLISATVNFSMNRRIVFKSNKAIFKSAIQYLVLAILIISINTILLSFIVYNLHINQYFAKILVEGLLFVISWLIQRYFVFNKEAI